MINIFEKAYNHGYKNVRPVLSALKLFRQSSSKSLCSPSTFQCDPSRHLSSNRDVAPFEGNHGGDLLLQSIRSASHVDHVLDAVSKHYSIMNNQQAMSALRSLFVLQKNKCTTFEKEDILRSKEFEYLCLQLRKQSRSMNLNSLVESLKVLSYFGAPATSAMVQTILHLIKHQVNELTLQQIIFLHFLCQKFEKNPIVEALTIALPLVFESNVKQKLDRENLNQLAQFLKYASQNKVSEWCIEELVTAVSLHQHSLQGRPAMQIAIAMLSVPNADPSYLSLAHVALDKVAQSIKHVRYEEMSYLLEKLADKCSKNRQFYNEQFVDKCALYVIQNNLGFHSAVWTLRRLSKMAHTSLELLDYIAEQIEANPEVLNNCKLTYIFALPAGFANADYKPKNWNQIKDLLLASCRNIPQDNVQLPWVKLALDFAALGCYDDSLFQYLFTNSFIHKFLDRENNLLDHLQLLSLYQTVQTLHPEYAGPFPSQTVIDKAKELNGENVKEFPLKSALEKGLGGELYVQTKCYTRMGHFIDHAVTVRKGGFPVALNQLVDVSSDCRVLIEDLKLPSDSQIVLVLATPPSSYSLNGKRLRGNIVLKIKTLEALGYAVISISTEDWKTLPDCEKIPFLMQAIRQKASIQFEDKSYIR